MDEPVSVRTETEDGWIFSSDYGGKGKSVAIVHIQESAPEQVEKNRRRLEAALRKYGYGLG